MIEGKGGSRGNIHNVGLCCRVQSYDVRPRKENNREPEESDKYRRDIMLEIMKAMLLNQPISISSSGMGSNLRHDLPSSASLPILAGHLLRLS